MSARSQRDFFLCRLDELAQGQARGFDPLQRGRDSIFALLHEGQVRIYRNSCPHLDVRLEYRKDRFLSADGQLIVCYAHGAQFLPSTGECVYGPCLGQTLEALRWRLEEGWLVLQMPDTECASTHLEVSRLEIHRIPTRD
jgi:nitrite reductase/ring-hydroxylating ferredoxin subunit